MIHFIKTLFLRQRTMSGFYRAAGLALVICLVLLIPAGCGGSEAEESVPVAASVDVPDAIPDEPTDELPLLWRVTADDGQTMYLFGSIHAAYEDTYPLPDFIMDAFSRCDYLAVEVDIVAFEEDFESQAELIMALMYQDGRNIADDIGEELHEMARGVVSELEGLLELGITIDMLDMFKPYMWTDLLTTVSIERAGMSAEYGLDKFFIQSATERGMEVLEIESISEQLALFLGLSQPLQNYLLEAALDIDDAAEGLTELYDMWLRGDERGVIESFKLEDQGMPIELVREYTNALLTVRDVRMTETAELYMSEGKTVFYVVGLGHLVGSNGIAAQLRQNGYDVERIVT